MSAGPPFEESNFHFEIRFVDLMRCAVQLLYDLGRCRRESIRSQAAVVAVCTRIRRLKFALIMGLISLSNYVALVRSPDADLRILMIPRRQLSHVWPCITSFDRIQFSEYFGFTAIEFASLQVVLSTLPCR